MLASRCLVGFEVHQYFFVLLVLVVNPDFFVVEYCFVIRNLDVVGYILATNLPY